jgi:hypothetical protein
MAFLSLVNCAMVGKMAGAVKKKMEKNVELDQ